MLTYIIPIITAVVIQNFVTSTPQLTTTPTETYNEKVSVEVVGEKNNRVFINDIEFGTIDSTGTLLIDLNTSGTYENKPFIITFKNHSNHVSNSLNVNIEKKRLSPPEITYTPSKTYKDVYSVEILGEAGSRVFVNGKEVAIIKSNDKVIVDLNTSGTYGSLKDFKIVLKNNENFKSRNLNISIEKEEAILTRLSAIKLLRQTSFTSTEKQIDEVMLNGEDAWITKQLNAVGAHEDSTDEYYSYFDQFLRMTHDINDEETLYGKEGATSRQIIEDPEKYFVSSSPHHMTTFNNHIFPEQIFESEDQLRHRMALALSQIIVISGNSTLGSALTWKSETLIKFYDELYKNSFGNYRDVLKEATMSSAMAYYLTYIGNKKEDAVTNTAPDENYARELMQLFSIGIYKLDLDGTKQIDSDGDPVPSYTQEDVSQLARVFTGWDWKHNGSFGNIYGNTVPNQFSLVHDIEFNSQWHDNGEKTVLGKTIPAGLGGEEEIDFVIDEILMKNPNMAPHVSRHLIMRFVTSNPSSSYVERVATAFKSGLYDGKGTGKVGDLKATIEAVIRDDEARGISEPDNFGKIDEFLLSFTHFASRLNVEGLNGDNKYNLEFTRYTSQLPMTAASVFNFYTNEDGPSDVEFRNNNLVAPEFITRIDSNLKKYMYSTSFRWSTGIGSWDAYAKVNCKTGAIKTHKATTWEEWKALTSYIGYAKGGGLKYDLRDIYEYVLDGHEYVLQPLRNNQAQYAWHSLGTMTDDEKEQKLSDLLDFISIKFLGKKLPEAYRKEILSVTIYEDNPAHMVHPMVRRVVNSSQFMILD